MIEVVPDEMDLQAKTISPILVIDDDRQVRAFLKESLTRNGYPIREAASGDIATEILADHRINLIVGDAAMLEPDGENTLRKLRRGHPGIRTLAMTGTFPVVSTNPHFVHRRARFVLMDTAGLKARLVLGADATVPKPISVDLLIETVKTLLGQ
jgi:CheY-like chemotaxis protein